METSTQSWSGFERAWTSQIIDSINFLRAVQGLTIKELAARLRDLGWPVSDATLSGMLSGKKRSSISVAELSIFSIALSTSPLYLQLGLPTSSEVPDHAIWARSGMPSRSVYEVGAWNMGLHLHVFHEEGDDGTSHEKHSRSVKVKEGSESALYFIERTAKLSEIIWRRTSNLVALETLESVDPDWRKKQLAIVTEDLEYALSALRRARKRALSDSEENALANVPLLDLPPAFAFVDTESSIADSLQAIPFEVFESMSSEIRVATFRRYFERLHDEELERLKIAED